MSAKIEQLKLMSTIYGCATVTIIALTGESSDAGLSGISLSRPKQLTESIGNHTLFTVPQHLTRAIEDSEWSNRAWTLQEEFLSRRSLNFASNQVEFSCMFSHIAESTDPDSVSEGLRVLPKMHSVQSMHHELLEPRIDSQFSELMETKPNRKFEGRMRFFEAMLATYTARRMSFEGDSLNAFLGMITALEQNLFDKGEFVHGLPLRAYPTSLGWTHDRNIVPKRREQFPSWSWAGWEGAASFLTLVLDSFDDRLAASTVIDLEPSFVAIDGDVLTMDGFTVTLDVRTEPFSEVFISGCDESIGSLMEGTFLHNNTLKTGLYSCLVLQRNSDKEASPTPLRQKLCLIVLDWDGNVAQRRTVMTMTPFRDYDFMQTKPERRRIRLR